MKIFSNQGSAGFVCQSTLKVDAEVSSVVYSPDGSKLAAAHGKSVSIFNVETGEVQCTVWGHSASVNCVDFSPDGLTIASGSGSYDENDNSVRVWDVKTVEQLCS